MTDQVSRPFQILLIGALVFAAAWFVFLRPKPPEVEAPSAPAPAQSAPAPSEPQSAPGRAVDKARDAVDATNNASAASTADPTSDSPTTAAPSAPTQTSPSGAGGGSAAPGAPARPARTDLPPAVARALDRRKVLLLLFWNPASSDDRAVRAELNRVDKRRGKVAVASAPISQLARYGAITRGVQVLQSPTVVVIDRNRKASTITGYTDTAELDQAVSDVFAAERGRR